MGTHHAANAVDRPLYARPPVQALGLAGLFAADGLVTLGMGGPLWLALPYLACGAALPVAHAAWARRRARPAAAPAAGRAARDAEAARPPGPPRVAIGYVRLP